MGRKYEIVNVGGLSRVRALRSWVVQDRQVNVGDVGGIVYDEKTLSQDGACWLFKGNFGFPGARIGGDSIVDVGEAAPDVIGSANLDILGTSTVVGAPVRFYSGQTAADAVTLGVADFEQGTFNYMAGTNWESWKAGSPNYLRTKAPIFMGGVAATLKLDVPGYTVQAYVLDRDGVGLTATAATNTGKGVTLAVPAGQYMIIGLAKNPTEGIVPADATAAQIKFTGTYETKLVVVDSRLELNPANGSGIITIRPGGTYTVASGVKYPDSVIQNSKVVINVTSSGGVRFMSDLSNVNAVLDATTADTQSIGTYRSINNLVFSGVLTGALGIETPKLVQAYNCDNMVVSTTNFPGLAAIQTAGVPIRFYNCNLNSGRFRHHAQIANTYRDINFDLATADLDKKVGGDHVIISSEVDGMYRVFNAGTDVMGCLVESFESVNRLKIANTTTIYNTTIYADAYLDGAFDLRGTNVIGNAVKKPKTRTIDVARVAVQGNFNTSALGSEITGAISSSTTVCVPVPFPIKGSKGLTVNNVPSGISGTMFFTTANNVIASTQEILEGSTTNVTGQGLTRCKAFLSFAKTTGKAITPEDIAGVTVTTYNGCKIVNTKASVLNIAGNVRVEDNATLIDTGVTGTGYFGGNSVIEAPTALTAPMPIEGAAYMKDNAVFSPILVTAGAGLSLLDMKNNAVFAGRLTVANMFYNITMADNARFLGLTSAHSGFGMRGNSFVGASSAITAACKGLLVMTGKARIESGNLTTVGHITLTGDYRQTAAKVWTGKRVIDSQDAPQYDNDVKTQYDF